MALFFSFTMQHDWYAQPPILSKTAVIIIHHLLEAENKQWTCQIGIPLCAGHSQAFNGEIHSDWRGLEVPSQIVVSLSIGRSLLKHRGRSNCLFAQLLLPIMIFSCQFGVLMIEGLLITLPGKVTRGDKCVASPSAGLLVSLGFRSETEKKKVTECPCPNYIWRS